MVCVAFIAVALCEVIPSSEIYLSFGYSFFFLLLEKYIVEFLVAFVVLVFHPG